MKTTCVDLYEEQVLNMEETRVSGRETYALHKDW